MIKELIEVGIKTVCTHYCETCFKKYTTESDMAFMCLLCSI
jgi:hypothetical protein